MKKTACRLSLSVVALLILAPPAAAQVDLQLVVQMPLAVVEVEEAGYPRADLGLLASGLALSELAPAEVIDVLRWAPVVWYLDELAHGDLFLAADPVRVDPVRVDPVRVRIDADPRRLRLIEDRDGSWLITTREDLVLLDLADREIERQWVIDRDAVVRDVDGRDAVRRERERDRRVDDRGMGAYVQWLHEQGLRGRELADAIHAELRRRGVPAGAKDRLDGPPPASRRFVAERLPDVLVVDGRLVELRDGDDERRLLPPAQARERLAAAPRSEDVRGADGRLARRGAAERAGGRGAAGRDVADRARGRGAAQRDDRGGGPPDHAEANRGGRGQGGDARAEGRGQENRGGGGGQGKGKGKAKAGGEDGGPGKGKANAGGGGGGGQGKGKGNAGGGGQGKGKGKGGGG